MRQLIADLVAAINRDTPERVLLQRALAALRWRA